MSIGANPALWAVLVLAVSCRGVPSVDGAELGPAEIARLEDARSDGGGQLQGFLAHGVDTERERAAVALGRLPWPEHGLDTTRALVHALHDASPRVRAAAAFGLGLRGDSQAAFAFVAQIDEPDARVRARIVEAASRMDSPTMRGIVLRALDDPELEVREEAAVAPQRWKTDGPDAAEADAALVRVATSKGSDVEVVWRALFSLARRKAGSARTAFVAGLASTDARARIFSAQGLGAIAADAAGQAALRAALSDRDSRVACEAAIALGKHPAPESAAELLRRLDHPAPVVRRCILEALGAYASERAEIRPRLEHARLDVSPNVRAAAIATQSRLFGDESAPGLELVLLDKDPLVRAGAAQAAAHLSPERALPLLERLARDSNLRVAELAIEGLGKHATPGSREILRGLLESPDNGLRLSAVEALAEAGKPEDLPALSRCIATSRGDISSEIAVSGMKTAQKIGGADSAGALEILNQGLRHADPFVRRQARVLLHQEPARSAPAEDRGPVPVAGVDYPLGPENPRVAIDTNRGTMVFELFRSETPVHVFNFLTLAARGHYDGLPFHRVAPDFVIQGGDARGDGNGATTWRGAPLRAEFTPRKYVRGSLGMPRNDDPDSGGSQIFVTHRETPHLDGRYTLFGQLVLGFDVLDAIEVGDTIRAVRVLTPAGAGSGH